jgi:hypothetical protein
MNNKGWLLVVEVFIAMLIMFSFLFITYSKQISSNNLDVDSVLDYLVKESVSNQDVRSDLLSSNFASVNNYFIPKINSRFNFSFQECNPNCENSLEIKKDVYSSTFFIWKDKTEESKKFVVYLWLKD